MILKHYDCKEIDVIVGGLEISGWAEGAFVEFDSAEEGWTTLVGTDGIVTRVKNENEMVRVTLKLSQSSDSNAVLTALYDIDRASPGGAGVVPILIRDKQGTSLFASDKAWVVKKPAVTYDKTPTPREWMIDCAGGKNFVGGN